MSADGLRARHVAIAVVVSGVVLYFVAYSLLCEGRWNAGSGTSGSERASRVRAYRWSWCLSAFAPAAWLHGLATHRRVFLWTTEAVERGDYPVIPPPP